MSSVKAGIVGAVGELILGSPATLNALTHEDIKAFSKGLVLLENDESVKAIVVRSETPKAFCAGGDMKQIRKHILAEEFEQINDYFTDEYALNLAISRCRKPFISLMPGFTMGGGLGISVHGHFRIVTETSVLAMPETRIGFFPDVGGSYFLPRLPHRSGYWMALTAAPVKGYQAVCAQLATHYVPALQLEALTTTINKALQTLPEGTPDTYHQAVSHSIDTFATHTASNEFNTMVKHRESWFIDDDLDAIRARLKESASSGSADAEQLLALLDAGSPYSNRITLQLFNDAKDKDLAECLKLELALSAEATRFPDCAEGVRAVLVDKDHKPEWQP